MRLVVQRVRRSAVLVDDQPVAEIGHGLNVLVGVGHGDSEAEATWLAEKVAHLRVFEDEQGLTNRSLLDVSGEALVISQFTLYADARKGRRPGFTDAAPPEQAEPLVQRFADHLSAQGVPVKLGVFGAHMTVEIVNDGPVTILLERSPSPDGG